MDPDVIEFAQAEERILVTEDKDFGWLVFARRVDSPGVILIRYPASARSALATDVVQFVREHGSRLAGSFVVLRPG